MLTQLKEHYEEYAATIKEVRKNARMFDGFLGLGKDPRNHPCHDTFYQAVGAWTEAFVASQPEQDAAMEAARFILETPLDYKEQECYWFMFAAHGYIKPLISYLGKENCALLGQRLEDCYKKRDRMPLQKELLKLLAKAAK